MEAKLRFPHAGVQQRAAASLLAQVGSAPARAVELYDALDAACMGRRVFAATALARGLGELARRRVLRAGDVAPRLMAAALLPGLGTVLVRLLLREVWAMSVAAQDPSLLPLAQFVRSRPASWPLVAALAGEMMSTPGRGAVGSARAAAGANAAMAEEKGVSGGTSSGLSSGTSCDLAMSIIFEVLVDTDVAVERKQALITAVVRGGCWQARGQGGSGEDGSGERDGGRGEGGSVGGGEEQEEQDRRRVRVCQQLMGCAAVAGLSDGRSSAACALMLEVGGV